MTHARLVVSLLPLLVVACPGSQRVLVRAQEGCRPAVYGDACDEPERDLPCDPTLSCEGSTVRWGPGTTAHVPAGVCVDDLTPLCAVGCGSCPYGCFADAEQRAASHLATRGAATSLLHARDLLCALVPPPDAGVDVVEVPDAAMSPSGEAVIPHPGLLRCPGEGVLRGPRCDDPNSHVDCLGLEGFSCSDGVVRQVGGLPFPTPNVCGVGSHVVACTLGCRRCAEGCAVDWPARVAHMRRSLGPWWWRDGDGALLCAETAWTPAADAGAGDAR